MGRQRTDLGRCRRTYSSSEYEVPDRRVIKDHALPRPHHIVKRGLRQIGWGDGRLSNGDLGPAVAGGGLCLDVRLVTPEKDEQTPLGPCMLHRDSHELLDQRGEHNLARECL